MNFRIPKCFKPNRIERSTQNSCKPNQINLKIAQNTLNTFRKTKLNQNPAQLDLNSFKINSYINDASAINLGTKR